jgi:CHASE2 domain-containing sensor protein
MRQSLLRRFAVGCALGAAAAALAWALGHTAFLRTVELKTYDYRVRLTADPSPDPAKCPPDRFRLPDRL